MRYPCANCGRCENSKVKSYYSCPLCRYANSTKATRCEKCGFVFPPLPGSTASRGDRKGDADDTDQTRDD